MTVPKIEPEKSSTQQRSGTHGYIRCIAKIAGIGSGARGSLKRFMMVSVHCIIRTGSSCVSWTAIFPFPGNTSKARSVDLTRIHGLVSVAELYITTRMGLRSSKQPRGSTFEGGQRFFGGSAGMTSEVYG